MAGADAGVAEEAPHAVGPLLLPARLALGRAALGLAGALGRPAAPAEPQRQVHRVSVARMPAAGARLRGARSGRVRVARIREQHVAPHTPLRARRSWDSS